MRLDERRAVLDPVAVIEVEDAVDFARGRVMDVAADDAVAAGARRSARRRCLEQRDVGARIGHGPLEPGRERPLRQPDDPSRAIEQVVDREGGRGRAHRRVRRGSFRSGLRSRTRRRAAGAGAGRPPCGATSWRRISMPQMLMPANSRAASSWLPGR